jgi:hypothetical protein
LLYRGVLYRRLFVTLYIEVPFIDGYLLYRGALL